MNKPTGLLQAIKERRSIRRYENREVPSTLINSLIEAAIWAPSAHNRQPWRFAIIQSNEQKQELALAMGQRLRSDLQQDVADPAVIEADVNRSYQRITQAPALILLALSMIDMDDYPDAKRSQNERIMAIQSTAMAGQNLLLAAHDQGLGACWMCAPLFCPDVVQRTLNLPDDWEPQGLITLGFPAQQRQKERKPITECILWR